MDIWFSSFMEGVMWTNVCCNPFNKAAHFSKKKTLRPVQPWAIEKIPTLTQRGKICDSCRKEIAVYTAPNVLDGSFDDSDSSYSSQQANLESLNECLQAIGETPVVKKKLVHKSYSKQKINKIK